nr:RNA-directed DNA polymerase, eukaryota [Tanacetum cinerariifolium]
MMRHNKNLMDINIDALYNILKKNQGDVNNSMGLKNKMVVVTFDALALIVEKTKVSKRKENIVVSLDSEESDAYDFIELRKITALLAKAFNRRKFYSKLINNNLQTSSASQSANKKQEYVKSDDKKVEKKDDEKKRDMSKVKCYNCKKEDKDEQVLLAEDHAWMKSSSDSDQKINANMVFMAQIKKVFLTQKLAHRLPMTRFMRYHITYHNLKKNQGDVNNSMGLKKKMVVVTSDALALIVEKTKVSKRKENIVVSLDSEESDADDFIELRKITALLEKAFNRRKFYSKLINNNLQTSSAS